MKSWVRYDDEWVDIHQKQGMLAMTVDSSLYDGVYVVKHAHGKYVDLVWYATIVNTHRPNKHIIVGIVVLKTFIRMIVNSLLMLKKNMSLQIWMKMIFGLANELCYDRTYRSGLLTINSGTTLEMIT